MNKHVLRVSFDAGNPSTESEIDNTGVAALM